MISTRSAVSGMEEEGENADTARGWDAVRRAAPTISAPADAPTTADHGTSGMQQQTFAEFMSGDWVELQVQRKRMASLGKMARRTERPPRLRGAHLHPPLRETLPRAVAARMPPRALAAADAFDVGHRRRWDVTEKLVDGLSKDSTHLRKQHFVSVAMCELFRGRYAQRIPASTPTTPGLPVRREKAAQAPRRKPPPPPPEWGLEESIWAPRSEWSESRSCYDTDGVERALLDADWARALRCGLGKYIYGIDDGESEDGEEEAEDEAADKPSKPPPHGADEVGEVYAVLWQFHDLLNATFDFYACLTSSTDVTALTRNAFVAFATDCKIPDKASKFCKLTHVEQLFIAVDAQATHKLDSETDGYNRKKALSRHEFLQCVVRLAALKYVMAGKVRDVSDAVYQLMVSDIEPNLDPKIFIEPNIFRAGSCYREATDAALRGHEASLRLIFDKVTKLQNYSLPPSIVTQPVVGFEAWRDFCRALGLVDADLTERDCTLAFVWSRMRVRDEQAEGGRVRSTHLSFEDFLEALTRISVLKAWPHLDEMAEAGASSAGRYLHALKVDDPDAYAELLASRATPWGHEPPLPVATCVSHLCSVLIVTCQDGKGDDKALSEKQANRFFGPIIKKKQVNS